jgi:hypothetical protein
MLTAISLYSLPFLFLMWMISSAPSPRGFILARRLPKLRPTLRVCGGAVVILAIDFAAIAMLGGDPRAVLPLCIWDGVVVLGLIAAMTSAQRSILDLWGFAATIGIFMGAFTMLTTPSAVGH